MAISFGPGGNSLSWGKRKFPDDLPDYLRAMGLNGYEVECGRGVRLGARAGMLPEIAEKNGICVTLHAPYYISLSSTVEETRLKSVDYILQSAQAARTVGAKKIVVHSGSCGKISREEALALAADTLKRAQAALDEAGYGDIIICPETMGKINQLGTLEEVVSLCGVDERFLPCVDFGHLNARTLGGIKGKAEYAQILDYIEHKLGHDRLSRMHIHFSRIEFTAGGEKRHVTLADKQWGPDYEPLMEELHRRALAPSIICESDGTQAEDAAEMKRYYEQCTMNNE